jgi:hypothetical protein
MTPVLTSSETMPPAGEKLVDRALDDQESARKTFLRDTKLALIVMLVFQFWILPRFVNLSNSIDTNNRKIAILKAQDSALQELQKKLKSLRDIVRSANEELAKRLYELPTNLHRETQRLDAEIQEIRESSVSGAPRPARNPAVQTNVQEDSLWFLSGISEDEQKRLLSPDERIFRPAVAPIVLSKIIQPAFSNLNSELTSSMKRPFAAQRRNVEGVLMAKADILRSTKTDIDGIRELLAAAQKRIEDFHFVVPESDFWWGTLQGKEGMSHAQVVNTTKVTGELQGQLLHLSNQNSATESRISGLLPSMIT